MAKLRRRTFFPTPLATPLAATAPAPTRVQASGDGVPYTPEQYAELLGQLAAQGKAKPDNPKSGSRI